MATQNILFIRHEQFLKIMEERIQNEGMELTILRIMHDYLAQKRKSPWTINLEKIFILYVNVCIAVDATESIKESLNQYKFLTQATYSNSLESVLLHIRTSVEQLFQGKISAFSLENVRNCGDIESEDIEHNLLTSYITLDEKKMDIQIKKILRQLMDIYKIIIETSKVHKGLDAIYSSTVEKILEICYKYNRRKELRRFLDSQHLFLDQLQKREVDFSKNPNHIHLFHSETRDYLIKVRLDCVQYALKMEFYQQAFTQLEDISILLNLRKVTAPIKQRMISQYYLYLSQVFWNSKYYNYHSFFLYHHLLVYRTNPSATPKEVRDIADLLLLGILSIPQNALENTQHDESKQKIALLQKSSTKNIPKKEEIVNMVLRNNLNEIASEPVNALFTLTLNEINIFSIAKKIEPIFAFLKENELFSNHIRPIEDNLINRVLSNISKVYKTLKVENLYKFLTFSSPDTCDQCLASSNSSNQLSCRIDQQKKIIIFNPIKAKNDYVNASVCIAALAQTAKIISSGIIIDQGEVQKKNELVSQAVSFLDSSKQILRARTEEIIQYKLKREKQTHQAQGRREFQDKQDEEKERMKKIEEYNRKIEEKRLREQVEMQLLKQKMEQRAEIIKIKGNQVAKIEGLKIENMTEEDLLQIDLETIHELKKNIQEKLKEAQENKYKKAFTKIDYVERETRKLEQEKIKQITSKDQSNLEEIVKRSKEVFDEQIAKKQVLSAAKNFKETFFKSLLAERQTEYETQLKQFKSQIEKEFKENILEQAYQSYKEDQIKKEEEDRLLKEAQQKAYLEKINNQETNAEQVETGWRIVRDSDKSNPTFEEFVERQKPSNTEDTWRTNDIVRSEATSNSFKGNSFLSGPVSDKISRNSNILPLNSEQESDNSWRTNVVKAVVQKPIETGPRFINTKRADGPPSNLSGNPNDGVRRAIPGAGGAPSSNSVGFSNSQNKPGFSKPIGTGNPNAPPTAIGRGIGNQSKPTNEENKGSANQQGQSWRKK